MRGFSHSLHLRERIIAPREKAYFSTGDSTKKKSNDQILSEERLPSLSLTKVKKKLQASKLNCNMFVPNEQEQQSFRASRWVQLTKKYFPEKLRHKPIPYDGQVDEIVLGCWKYGDKDGQKTIWKKYKQKCDSLSYDTLRILRRRAGDNNRAMGR